MQHWIKKGVLFCPENVSDWMFSHAANPFAVHLENDLYRVYFTCRDSQSRGHVAYVIVDIVKMTVLHVSDEPVLSPGALGAFDDSGVMMGYLLQDGDEQLLYYLGWNLGVTVPWRNSIGLAKWNKATGHFDKVSRAPVLDRHHVDPFSISYPSVLKESDRYRMWYGSNLGWGKEEADMRHVIKYAESSNGIDWRREGVIAIDLSSDAEYALSKPYVIKDSGLYKMWFSHRGNSYRIGYAESFDGIHWKRMDNQAGLAVSASGWDSEMVCYPFVFKHDGASYMLYNGNGYGKTGFGLAISMKQ